MRIRQTLVILSVIGLVASQTGMADQSETILGVVVGALNWDEKWSPGTAILIVSSPRPESPYGPIGSSFLLRGPQGWWHGQQSAFEPPRDWDGLYARWSHIAQSQYYVWWYLWPFRTPVFGNYSVEATLGGQRVRATTSLTHGNLPPPLRGIKVERVTTDEIEASWSQVPGAVSYAVEMVGATVTLPRDPGAPPNTTMYTTETSTTIRPRPEPILRSYRLGVYAFNVDLTEVPPLIPDQLNVSWAISPPFDFPPGAPLPPESGTVVEIRLDAPNPHITAEVFLGPTQVYLITPQTSYRRVRRTMSGSKTEVIDVQAIIPGDYVSIAFEPSAAGKIAREVTVYVREEQGIVRELGSGVITFKDGRAFLILPAVRVWISGQLAKQDDVRPGSSVIVLLNSGTGEVTEIIVL